MKGQSDKGAGAQDPRDGVSGMPEELQLESDSVDQLVSDLLSRIDEVAPPPGQPESRRSANLDALVADFLARDATASPTAAAVPVPEVLQSGYLQESAAIDAEVARTLQELDHARTPSPLAPSPVLPTTVAASPPTSSDAQSPSSIVASPDVVLEAPPSLADLVLLPTVLETPPPPAIAPSPEVVLEAPPPVDVELPALMPEGQPRNPIGAIQPAVPGTALAADVELPADELESPPPPTVFASPIPMRETTPPAEVAPPPTALESPPSPAVIESPPPPDAVVSVPAVLESTTAADAEATPDVAEAPPPPVVEVTRAEPSKAEALEAVAPRKEEPSVPTSECAPEQQGYQEPPVADDARQLQHTTAQVRRIPWLLIAILIMVAILLIGLGLRFCAGRGPGRAGPAGSHVSLQTSAT